MTPHEIDISATVDAYVAARAARLALDKKVGELKAVEDAHKKDLMVYMTASGQSIVGSQSSALTLNTRIVPVAEDWGAIREYVEKNDAQDLYTNALSAAGVTARWEAGEEIPGVGRLMVKSLSVSKLKG